MSMDFVVLGPKEITIRVGSGAAAVGIFTNIEIYAKDKGINQEVLKRFLTSGNVTDYELLSEVEENFKKVQEVFADIPFEKLYRLKHYFPPGQIEEINEAIVNRDMAKLRALGVKTKIELLTPEEIKTTRIYNAPEQINTLADAFDFVFGAAYKAIKKARELKVGIRCD